MRTRSGKVASPLRGDTPSSSDEEAHAGRGRGRRRVAVRKVCIASAQKLLAPTKDHKGNAVQASSSKAGDPSIRRGPINISRKSSPPNKLPKHKGNVLKTKAASSGDPFKRRFSVHRICGEVGKFSEDQIAWIRGAGLGALLSMSEFSIPVKFVAWIIKHVNPDLREFRLKDKVIVFDNQLICNIVSVPSGTDPVKTTCTATEYEAFQ